MKKYAISALVDQFNKQLSLKQRASSLFSEAPVIAGKVLRRGVEIILTEAQYLQHNSKITVLLNAGAIKVRVIEEGGKVRIEKAEADQDAPLLSVTVTPPESGVVSPDVSKEAEDLSREVVKDVSATSDSAQTWQPDSNKKSKKVK